MPTAASRRDSCRLCADKRLKLVLPLAPTPVADAYVSSDRAAETQPTYPLDLFLCSQCGHVQLLDVVDPELLFRDYHYVSSVSLGLVEHFRTMAEDLIVSYQIPQDALVVDIGSNDGSSLRCFQARGMRVLGIDPAREIARKATADGLETWTEFFSSGLAHRIKAEKGPAALVTAHNVFAHSDQLSDMALGVRELLAPDGIFVFEVSYLVDVIEKTLLDTVYHEHLSYHSVKPLQSFFARHGLELIDAQRIPTKGGSLRGVAQRLGGSRPVRASVAQLVGLEESLGLARAQAWLSFAQRLAAAKSQLRGLLADLKEKGKTMAGYGASTGVTTLIYEFGLEPFLPFIVDDNLRKQQLLSPGYHIPVLSPQALYERKPDYVLILAWNYSRPIMEKHKAFLKGGGHFIVPLPEVEMRSCLS